MKFLKKTIEYLFYIFVFTLPWQTKLILRPAETNYNEISLYFSHIILILILLLFAVYQIGVKRGGNKIPWMWYLLAGLEMFIFISLFLAPDRTLAWYRYLILLIGAGLFYVLREETRFIGYGQSYINKFRLIYVFLSSIFLHAVLGIYQFLTQSSFAFKYFGLASHGPEILGSSVIETFSGRWLRSYGGFDHPNIFGGVLAISLLIAAYLLVKKKVINSQRQVMESLFLFVFYFISLFALFFSCYRSAWLAFGFGLLILLFVFISQKDRWIVGRFVALIIFSAILIGTAVIPYSDLVETRFRAESRLEQQSIDERQEYISQASTMLENHFWLGVGIGNYVEAVAIDDDRSQPAWVYQPVHNSFILLAVESGIFSLLFFLGFLIYLVKKDRREDFSWAIFIALVVLMLFDHWILSLPFGVIFLFLILGLI